MNKGLLWSGRQDSNLHQALEITTGDSDNHVYNPAESRSKPGRDSGSLTAANATAAALEIYRGSNGEATKALYDQLELLGPGGTIALNLFRACKASERAKVYRGGNGRGSYRGQAYDKKQWSMTNLCSVLFTHAPGLRMTWGWGLDPKAIGFEHVLYVEIPTGQVSFHTNTRGTGPDYSGEWDGARGQSAERICRWVGELLAHQAWAARA